MNHQCDKCGTKRDPFLIAAARRAGERSLRTRAAPWRLCGVALYGVVTTQTETRTTSDLLYREAMLEALRMQTGDEVAESIAKRIEARASEIPHVVIWDGGTDLEFIEPPDDVRSTARGGRA